MADSDDFVIGCFNEDDPWQKVVYKLHAVGRWIGRGFVQFQLRKRPSSGIGIGENLQTVRRVSHVPHHDGWILWCERPMRLRNVHEGKNAARYRLARNAI